MANKYYITDGKEGTHATFNKKMVYRGNTILRETNRGNSNVVDFNFGDKIYYGKVNEHFSPVFLPQRKSFGTSAVDLSNKRNTRLKAVTAADSQRPQYAIDFVADIFEEMRSKFIQAAAAGKIEQSHPYLSNLKVYKSYTSPENEYLNYKKILFQQLKTNIRKSGVLIKNFDDFIRALVNVAPLLCSKTPFTFAGYIKSTKNTVMSSGFALEIADMSKTNDAEKINTFYNSANWDYFVQACNNYGFMIDYECPWRIVCDIAAPDVQQYIYDNGNEDYRHLLTTTYSSAGIRSLYSMPQDLLDLYNMVRTKKIVIPSICSEGKTILKTIQTAEYTINDIYLKYGLRYFAHLYLKMRFFEENQGTLSVHEQYQIKKDVLRLCDTFESFYPVEIYFERFINKPFDKKFSTGYYVNVAWPATINRMFERSEIDAYSSDMLSSMSY